MAGPHSDPTARPPRHDGYQDRPTVRLSNLYATAWRAGAVATTPLAEQLRFGRLAGYYRQAAAQLPAVITSQPIDPDIITSKRWSSGSIQAGRLWLLAMPSGQVIVALSLDVDSDLTGVIDLLEDCYYEDLNLAESGLVATAATLARRCAVQLPAGQAAFAPERHQIVYSRALDLHTDPQDTIQRVVYRADLPHRPEYSAIAYPAELNRRPTTLAAVGPYVSVLCGQQDYVENAAFASAAQAVASAARLREVREALHQDLLSFRDDDMVHTDTRARRVTLEQIFDELTALELDLSLSVETPRDLRLLVPSLRVVAYHEQVYDAIGLNHLAETISRMLRRLEAAIRAELTTVESMERRADEDRRLRWGIAVGFVSTVAIPLSLLLAFFGVNATQVDEQRSMFDPGYIWIYLAVGLLAAVTIVLSVTLQITQQRHRRRGLRNGPREFLTTRSPIPLQRPAGAPPDTSVRG